jgi:NAD(P)-dependent dehydrogenase (short-subunit alcohol dehydrogenase family)
VVVNDIGTSLNGEGRDTSAADAVVAEIKAAGGKAIANYEDITDWDAAKRIVDAAVAEFGDLHVVVNNAGIVRDRMFVSATLEEWDATMHVHLRGHFCLSRHAVDYWRGKQKAGTNPDARIINTSSGAGLQGSIAQAAYSTAKGGIASLTLVQAAELGRYGITANALAPSARTRMTEQAFAEKMATEGQTFDVMDPANIAPTVVWLGGRVRACHWLRLRTRRRQDHARRRLARRAGGGQGRAGTRRMSGRRSSNCSPNGSHRARSGGPPDGIRFHRRTGDDRARRPRPSSRKRHIRTHPQGDGQAMVSTANCGNFCTELGLSGVGIPEALGGAGLGMVEFAIIAEAAGAQVAALPLLGLATAARAIAAGGSDAQKAEWLPKLISGEASPLAKACPR